jgi:hypothetical protein
VFDPRVIYVAKSPAEEGVVVTWRAAEGVSVMSAAGEHSLAPDWAPVPTAIDFPSADGRAAHALCYPRRADSDAQSAGLDEREQLAREHHRLRHLRSAHPLAGNRPHVPEPNGQKTAAQSSLTLMTVLP